MIYNHRKIEKKWQKKWEAQKIYKAEDNSKKKKFYSLIEFPYPSGDGLHVGHIRSNTAMDIVSRKRRMEGFNVLYPIGWDAFGLPTENFAIKTGKKPSLVTKKNTDTFRKQLKEIGFSFDWSREINTTDPKYYKWTQWIFLQFFKKGLAYKAKSYINWCPKDKIGLANEEAVGGICDRCGSKTEKKEKEQWMLAITKYADRLDKDLDLVDYPERVKTQQRNWIGKSEGVLIKFDDIEIFTTRPETIFGATFVAIAGEKDCFTGKYVTNPATKEKIPVWEAEYVMAEVGTGALMGVPAHDERDFEFAKKYSLSFKYVIAPYFLDKKDPPRDGAPHVPREAVNCYVYNPKNDSFLFLDWKTTKWRGPITGGVDSGEDLVSAGMREIAEETGYKNLRFIKYLGSPIRADFYHPHKKENRLALFYGLYFELVDEQKDVTSENEEAIHSPVWVTKKEALNFINEGMTFYNRIESNDLSYTGKGKLINSGKFNDLNSNDAKKEITEFVGGKMTTKYKLRDWVFSRQRYWGEPIPVINCEKCGLVPVSDKDLPVKLPDVKNYKPTDTGESPLASISKWVNVKCPKCKGKAKRETDTMPNWAGSSWYYLRYIDPKNSKEFVGKKKLKYWSAKGDAGPVDWYNGGMEHTTLHLLYSRFWHKFLYDLKLIPTIEPYKKRTSHGMILGEGGIKMSKSVGNVVNPDDIVKNYGADTLRIYEMFMGPFEDSVAWSTESIIGSRRFIEKVWRVAEKVAKQELFHRSHSNLNMVDEPNIAYAEKSSASLLSKLLNKTIKKVSQDIENMRFNTAISSMMILTNEMEKSSVLLKDDFKKFLQILSPFAPHITEEIWSLLGEKKSIHKSSWPEWDEKLIKDEEVKIAVQVNGKLRAELIVFPDDTEETIKEKVLHDQTVLKFTGGQMPIKIIYVKNRLVNIVV